VKNFTWQLAGAILMTLAAGMTAFNCVTALPFALMCQFCCTTHSWLLVCHMWCTQIQDHQWLAVFASSTTSGFDLNNPHTME
jgi:hypothetical protein